MLVCALKTQEMGIVLAPDRKAVKLDLKIIVDAEFAETKITQRASWEE